MPIPDQSNGRGRRKAAALAVLTFLLICALAACSDQEDPSFLAALRADPMSSFVPPSATEAQRFEQDRSGSSNTSLGRQAQVLRTLKVGEVSERLPLMRELRDKAQQEGWILQSDTSQGIALDRTGLGDLPMRLTIASSATEPTSVALSLTAG